MDKVSLKWREQIGGFQDGLYKLSLKWRERVGESANLFTTFMQFSLDFQQLQYAYTYKHMPYDIMPKA